MLKKALMGTGFALFLFSVGLLETAISTYKLPGVCVETRGGLATFEDSRGHSWDVYGNFDEGAEVTLVFSDNHTPNVIRDDILKEVK